MAAEESFFPSKEAPNSNATGERMNAKSNSKTFINHERNFRFPPRFSKLQRLVIGMKAQKVDIVDAKLNKPFRKRRSKMNLQHTHNNFKNETLKTNKSVTV